MHHCLQVILRWRMQSGEESEIPFTRNISYSFAALSLWRRIHVCRCGPRAYRPHESLCAVNVWPNPEEGRSVVSVEFEHNTEGLTLTDVQIAIPCECRLSPRVVMWSWCICPRV